jgi:hypothetical protein
LASGQDVQVKLLACRFWLTREEIMILLADEDRRVVNSIGCRLRRVIRNLDGGGAGRAQAPARRIA